MVKALSKSMTGLRKKKYPEVLGGVEIGNGKVRMNIPVINKVIEFDTDDIKTLKETLITK
jgi:hypothetical protein